MDKEIYDIIIIGAGPAGLAAGIYASRSKNKTLILNEGVVGGQLVLTHEIANYPGVSSTSGYGLASTMKKQAKEFGCAIKSNVKITGMKLDHDVKEVTVNNHQVYFGKTVILSPGGSPRKLNVAGEEEFKGKGISYCATCDGDFFQDKEIVVVGGGNSALEEAVSLTKYASKVTVIHQFDHFQAFNHAVKEAEDNEKISFLMNSEIIEFKGGESLKSVVIRNNQTHKLTELAAEGAFIFIGYVPNTEFLKDHIALNEYGYILTDDCLKTSVDGVYAAGDSLNKKFRQVTTAVADGTVSALCASEYLNRLN